MLLFCASHCMWKATLLKKDAREAQKSARAELPRTGEEELGRVVLANTESR